jgi:peptidoglycan hydrolase-like protein with peptidoglycan-binding domain
MLPYENVPGLIPRSAWGARYPDGFRDRPVPVSELWLHHSVTQAPDLHAPFDDDDAAVRLLEDIGQSRFGGGISYTIVVTPVGRAYVGHSWWRQGAHTLGHNTVGSAICLVGDYSVTRPTDAQMNAIAHAMCSAQQAGLCTRHTLTGGHRDVYGTECPGNAGYAAIPEINARANAMWGSHDGPPPPAPHVPPAPASSAPAFPLPQGHAFGPRSGPAWQHSGYASLTDREGLLRWQSQMRKRGWNIGVDGYYGGQTKAIAGAFQRQKNLQPVDDLIGIGTWRAAWLAPIT